jgi:cysteine-rich repeat protein
MRRALLSLVLTAFTAIPFAACSNTGTTGARCTNAADPKSYKPGDSVYCTCPDRSQGLKVCGEDAVWEACGPCIPEEPFEGEDAGGGVSDAPYGCGDGVSDDEETCDDGNLKDGDLCDSRCRPTGNPEAAGKCPGQPLHVWSRSVELVDVSTATYSASDKAATPCRSVDGGPVRTGSTSPERIYEVHAHSDGMLTVTTRNSTFDQLLYIRSECSILTSELVCVNRTTGIASETISVPVKTNDVRYVFLDGALNDSGKTTLTFDIK